MLDKKRKQETQSIFQKVLEDKRAIRECIRKGEDISKIEKERGIKFATPL